MRATTSGWPPRWPPTGHTIFFEADESRILVVRVLHDSMDYRRHLNQSAAPVEDD